MFITGQGKGVAGLDRYVERVQNVAERFPDLGLILFSDSVVAYSSDDSEETFELITAFSAELFYELVAAEIPVRGAIAHGEFVRSINVAHGTVIAGRPIIEAHHYEQQLQWIGVMLAPSVLDRYRDIPGRCDPRVAKFQAHGSPQRVEAAKKALKIQPGRIPLAMNGDLTQFEGYAIVPIPNVFDVEELLPRIRALRGILERLKMLAPEARSQDKYNRTIEWVSVAGNRLAEAELKI